MSIHSSPAQFVYVMTSKSSSIVFLDHIPFSEGKLKIVQDSAKCLEMCLFGILIHYMFNIGYYQALCVIDKSVCQLKSGNSLDPLLHPDLLHPVHDQGLYVCRVAYI